MYGKNHYNTVISLQLIKINEKKKNNKVTKTLNMYEDVHANEYMNMKKITEGYPVDY